MSQPPSSQPDDRESQPEELQAVALPPIRERLLDTRESITLKFSVCGTEGYLIVGLFEDGRPGELFIKIAKEGSTLCGLFNTIGILTSMGLQHGVPLQRLAGKLRNTRFEPLGYTTSKEIPVATSIVDYIFHWLTIKFPEEQQTSQPEHD